MNHTNDLYSMLTSARNALGDSIYSRVLPHLIEAWQYENNDPLIDAVLAGETTLEDRIKPLVDANLAIDPHVGTTVAFTNTVEEISPLFRNILSLTKFRVGNEWSASLTGTVDTWRKKLRSNLTSGLIISLPLTMMFYWFMRETIPESVNMRSWEWLIPYICLFSLYMLVFMTPSSGKMVARRRLVALRVLDRVRQLDETLSKSRRTVRSPT